MRTRLITLVTALGLANFALVTAANAAPAASSGSSGGAVSTGGGFSGGGFSGGGGGGGGSHGGGSSGGGGSHGGGGGSSVRTAAGGGGGWHAGGGGGWHGGGGGSYGGGHWSGGSSSGAHAGGGHWSTGSTAHGSRSAASGGVDEIHASYYGGGSYIARGANGARGGYGIVGYDTAGLGHGTAAPHDEHAARTALAVGPQMGSAARASRALPPRSGPHTRPNGPHRRSRAIRQQYADCLNGDCPARPRLLLPVFCPAFDGDITRYPLECPLAYKVKVKPAAIAH